MKRESLATKARRGTLRRDRARKELGVAAPLPAVAPVPEAVERPPAQLPPPPPGASATVRAFYATYAPILAEQGRLERSDWASFELMADAYDTAVHARERLAKDGYFRYDEAKVLRKHPALQVVRDATQTYTRLAARFGLMPFDRERLREPRTPREADPLDTFIQRRAGL